MTEPRDLEQWTVDLAGALGLDPDVRVDIAGVLDLARLAAHEVARPAAPLTTFLAGFALARGASFEHVADVVARLAEAESE
jgi:ABC-type cobalamin transport system permease subunit